MSYRGFGERNLGVWLSISAQRVFVEIPFQAQEPPFELPG